MRIPPIRISLAVIIVLILVTRCDEEGDLNQSGTLVGRWQLTELTVDWVRDIAQPAGSPADTVYLVTGRMVDSTIFSHAPALIAPQTIAAFMVGDTILDTVPTLNSVLLELMDISMTATFNEDFSYSITGTYPTLRLVEDSCRTDMIVLQIFDSGIYETDYITGRFGIQPGQYEQVLPTFDDGTLTFYNNGIIAEIIFIDRDGHDQLVTGNGSWDESKRAIHGAANLPVDAAGAFARRGWLSSTGYIRDRSERLSGWGGFLTLYALTTKVAAEQLMADSSIAYEDAILLLEQWATEDLTEEITGLAIPYATLLDIDDSAAEFDVANAEAGGKLRFEIINPVCVPVNEIIEYTTIWTRIPQD
jgi:hypothetical protein